MNTPLVSQPPTSTDKTEKMKQVLLGSLLDQRELLLAMDQQLALKQRPLGEIQILLKAVMLTKDVLFE